MISRKSKHRFAALAAPAFTPETGACPLPGYRLGRLRGTGGFATVWEATDPAGEAVALKFMSSHNATSTVRELRALRALSAIRHPHLLPVRQVWCIPGQIVIGMDLAEASLLDLMMLYRDEFEAPIDPARLLGCLRQVADALDFLNARRHQFDGRTVGFQHGDVKPNNVLLVGETALLADYGLATPTSSAKTPCHRHGTAEYAAPEVFQGYAADSSDQFSLGVTYHVLRTGRFPFPPPPSVDALTRGYVRPAADVSFLPPAERPIVARALSVIPQDRYPTCSALVAALTAAVPHAVQVV